MKKQLLILFWLLLFLQVQTICQEKEKVQRIILKDGSELVGMIVEDKADSIRFNTISGLSMAIPKNQIYKIEELAGEIIKGEFFRSDPNETRLLFSPTARPLHSGEGYFSVYEIFFPMVAFGIADVISVAGGVSLFPGAPLQIFYLAPKVTPLNTKNFDLAGGVLYLNSTEGDFEGVGILYGIGTFGSEKAAITCGLGWGFADEVANEPVIMIGGELRLSNSIKLISENWIPPDSDVQLLSLGVRFFGEKLAADFALVHPFGSGFEGWPFIPWIGFAYNF